LGSWNNSPSPAAVLLLLPLLPPVRCRRLNCRNAAAAIWASKQRSCRRDGENKEWKDRMDGASAAAASSNVFLSSYRRNERRQQ